jgi:hypothetical protein
MATYVNNLRLKEIATGDESGTWGTSTNTNLELIGEALGYNTQDCFASDADATTTVADGSTDPARAFYFKVTSSATLTATRTLTIAPNTVSRVMIIENATTGSQSIAISQGSGANVTVPTGEVKMVYLDGAGSGAAVLDAFTNLKVTDAAQTNITSVGTLTGLTVSGDATFDTNTLKVDSTNNRVGIGTASPSNTLSVVGVITSGDFTSVGAGGTPADLNTAEVGRGYINLARDDTANVRQITFGKNGAVHSYLETTTSGLNIGGANVGIGTASPSSRVDIVHDNNNPLRLQNSTGVIVKTQFEDNASRMAEISLNTGAITFSNGTSSVTERMRIDSSGQVGIGTTSPATDLQIAASDTTSEIQFTHSGTGTGAGNGMWISANGNDFDIRNKEAGNTSLWTNNAERVTINSSGSVGIGTTSPSYLLDISGDSRVRVTGTNASNFGAYEAENNAGVGAFFGIGGNGRSDLLDNRAYALGQSTSDGLVLVTEGADPIIFAVNGIATSDEAMRIDSTGNVGIGTASPISIGGHTGVLTLYGSNATALVLQNSTSSSRISQLGSDLAFFNNTYETERMRLTSTGLGIGTTSPAYELEIVDSSGDANLSVKTTSTNNSARLRLTANGTGNSVVMFADENDTNVGLISYDHSDDSMNFSVADQNKMTIDSSGRLLVGATSGSQKLLVSDDANDNTILKVRNSGNSTPYGQIIEFSGAAPDDNTRYFLRCGDTGANRMHIYSDGDVNTSDAGTLTSDRSLKTDIADATSKLADINKLQVRNFKWITDYHPNKQNKHIGFIADEFETVFPSLVVEHENPIVGQDGTVKSVRYGALIPILVKALQEADDKIDALEARIEALEA